MPRGNEPLGEIATDVLFENDRVKIWNLIVNPGESSDWHLHGRDYVTIVVEGKGLKVEFDDGTVIVAGFIEHTICTRSTLRNSRLWS